MIFTKTEDGKYQMEDGRLVTRAEVIRELFKADWKRADIAKELDVPYNVVFQATANMENAHHAPGTGGVATTAMVELEDGTKIPRAEYIRQQVAAGKSRAEIAKELGISYSAVWNATKGIEGIGGNGNGGRKYVEVDGKQIPRAEYIRQRFLEGATRREIANELGVDYTVVWQATRRLKKQDKAEAEGEVVTSEPQPERHERSRKRKRGLKKQDKAEAEGEVVTSEPQPESNGGDDVNFPE